MDFNFFNVFINLNQEQSCLIENWGHISNLNWPSHLKKTQKSFCTFSLIKKRIRRKCFFQTIISVCLKYFLRSRNWFVEVDMLPTLTPDVSQRSQDCTVELEVVRKQNSFNCNLVYYSLLTSSGANIYSATLKHINSCLQQCR